MMFKYTLRGKEPVECHDLLEWARFFENKDGRIVAQDALIIEDQEVLVSTVFLGIDHNFMGGKPLLFETMIFGGPHNDYQERYSTWDEALTGHQKALKIARGLEK